MAVPRASAAVALQRRTALIIPITQYTGSAQSLEAICVTLAQENAHVEWTVVDHLLACAGSPVRRVHDPSHGLLTG